MAAGSVATHALAVSAFLHTRSARECPLHPAGHGPVSQGSGDHQGLFAPYLAALCRHPDYADAHRRDHVDQYHEGS